MKQIKKLIALAMIMTTLFACITLNVSAANDATAAALGFQVDTSIYNNIGWTNFLKTTYKNSNGKVMGVTSLKMLFATAKTYTSTKDLWVALYYIDVEPKDYKEGNCNYTGYPQRLTLQTQLPSNRSYISSTPQNVAGVSTYSIGISVSANGKTTAGVSGSTTVTKNALEITNKSSLSSNLYKVIYDYKAQARGKSSSRNKYLYNGNSQQRGALYYEKKKNTKGAPYFPVSLTGEFARMDAITTGYLIDVKVTTSWNVDAA